MGKDGQTQRARSQRLIQDYQSSVSHDFRPCNESETPERTSTNIVLPCNSVILVWSRYFARTMPPGQSCPPHSVGSSWSSRGGVSKPSKSIDVVEGHLGAVEGTRSSVTEIPRSSDSHAGMLGHTAGMILNRVCFHVMMQAPNKYG